MTGYGLRMHIEDAASFEAGFVKNEIVIAGSRTEATSRAIEQVRVKLRSAMEKGRLALGELDIRVDEVSHTWKFWKLLQQDGFIFFPVDAA